MNAEPKLHLYREYCRENGTAGAMKERLEKEAPGRKEATARKEAPLRKETPERNGAPERREAPARKEAPEKKEPPGKNGDTEVINKYVDETIDYFTIKNPALLTALERGLVKKAAFEEEVMKHVLEFPLTEVEKQRVYDSFSSFVWTYDVIDPLIQDGDVSDIKILSADRIRVKRLGKRMGTEVTFRSSSHYRKFVSHIAAKNKINLSNMNAMQTFTDKDSSPDFRLRFNIATEFVNSTDEPYVHIRKIPKAKKELVDLVAMGTLSGLEAEYLSGAARADAGMLFCGKGASGKTTCMNALLECIPHDKSCLAIQENDELFTYAHPDFMFQHIVENQGEGKIQYGLDLLAKNGLLTDLDYFIIGEIKGAEALYFLNAEYTGHRAWASIHANGAKEAFYKLADYIKYASDYGREDILKMLLNIRTIVYMKDFRVAEIVETDGWDEKRKDVRYKEISLKEGKEPGVEKDSAERREAETIKGVEKGKEVRKGKESKKEKEMETVKETEAEKEETEKE